MSFISSFCVSKNRIEDYFPQIIEQQFEELAKMLPSDWLRKYFSIHFVRVNKLNVFMRQLPTENLRQLLNT